MADPVFVQPHFDDVALSCGGTVASCAAHGNPTIVTIFAGEPTVESGGFARLQHQQWGLADGDAVAHRRQEDRNAAAELGTTINVCWLEFLDAIYRRPAYKSDDALFGELVPDDLPLAAEIASELSALGDLFVMPMAVGHHVDHQLTFRAGLHLQQTGKAVWLYADLPYSIDDAAYHSRMGELGNPEPCRREISSQQFERRWRAIERYTSQLAVIFRDIDRPRERFEQFATLPGDESKVELFWNLEDINDE